MYFNYENLPTCSFTLKNGVTFPQTNLFAPQYIQQKEEKYFLNVIICSLDISQIRWHFMFHLPPFNFLRRRPQRVEEGGRESDDSPDGDDEEEAEVTKALLDLLAHGRNQQIVDDVGRKKERVNRAAVSGQKKINIIDQTLLLICF